MQSENNLLFEKSPVPMWVVDAKSLVFLAVNESAIANYDYSREEFLSMTINDICQRPEVDRVKNVVERNTPESAIYDGSTRYILKNGRHIDVLVQSNQIKYQGVEARLVVASDITRQVDYIEELTFSERYFKALVQEGSDLISIVDINLNYKYVSPASLKLLGIVPESFLGRNVMQLIHPDDMETVRAEAEKLHTQRQVQFPPFRFKNSKGEWRWIDTLATNLIQDRSVGGIVFNSKDITERLMYEKTLAENTEKYKVVSRAMNDVIREYMPETGMVTWSQGICTILGYSSVGNTTDIDWWIDHIHPEDRARVLDKFERHRSEGNKRWEDEYRFLGADGSYRYILDRGYIGFDKNGKAQWMIGAMQDISRWMGDEHWSKLLESVVINTTDGVLITDADPKKGSSIIYVNDAIVKVSGYSKKELIGGDPNIFHGNNTDQKGLEKLEKAIKEGLPCNIELINHTREGTPYDVSVNVSPVTDNSGEITHWISIQRDITENKNYTKEIEEQNKKLMDIAWMQSHMVRSPLTKIMSLVELLLFTETDVETTELLDNLSKSASQLDWVIRTITHNTNLSKRDE